MSCGPFNTTANTAAFIVFSLKQRWSTAETTIQSTADHGVCFCNSRKERILLMTCSNSIAQPTPTERHTVTQKLDRCSHCQYKCATTLLFVTLPTVPIAELSNKREIKFALTITPRLKCVSKTTVLNIYWNFWNSYWPMAPGLLSYRVDLSHTRADKTTHPHSRAIPSHK